MIFEWRIFLPVRVITEALGAEVGWDPDERAVSVTKGDTEVLFRVGSNMAMINGLFYRLEGHVRLIDGRTMVPLRFLTEAFDCVITVVDLPDGSREIYVDELEEYR
jgi:hypothetical protein